jgi:hypothetical protein
MRQPQLLHDSNDFVPRLVAATLTAAAEQSTALIASYTQRN